jgi:von Willebrand factor type A domain
MEPMTDTGMAILAGRRARAAPRRWTRVGVLLAAGLLLGAAVAQAQLADDARTSTLGTQFVKPAPKPTPPAPPAPPKAPEPPAPPVATPAAVEPPKPPPPLVNPPRYPSVVFLVDTSDSMLNHIKAGDTRTKLDEAKAALIQVLQEMAPDTRVQVWQFDTMMRPVLPPGVPQGSFVELGQDDLRAQLIERVRGFNTGGGTNLYQSIVKALDFFADPADQEAYRSGLRFPVLVVVSDGEDGGKTPQTFQSVQEAKARLPLVTVNTIGFNLDAADHSWFDQLCRIATHPDGCATANDEEQLRGILSGFYRFRGGS